MLIDDTLALLRDQLPECFSQGHLQLGALAEMLGLEEQGQTSSERYSFSWAGKADAVRLLQLPAEGALKAIVPESLQLDGTRNVFIEGENLQVLRLLYKPYFGRVKMIFIDPPYNTGGDFIYPDDFSEPVEAYLKRSGQKDEQGNLLTANPETSGRFHSDWLSMMYPRRLIARQLLRDDGVIFVAIDDTELANLRLLMNELFGGELHSSG